MKCADCRRESIYLFLASLLLLSAVGHAQAAVVDDFEGPQVTWQPGEADVTYRTVQHQRFQGDAHSGRSCELIHISAENGSQVDFIHPVGTAQIIAELSSGVWIKADRPGVQLMARVVLPHTVDPRTGGPISTFISGGTYTAVGAWQQLRINETPLQLSRQTRALQAKMGTPVDVREAYIDQLVLNVYGGPGETTVEIDDLEMAGVVPSTAGVQPIAAMSSNPPTAQINAGRDNGFGGSTNGASGSANRAATDHSAGNNAALHKVALSGSALTVDGRPMFPRIAQYQGEPLAWLKQLGFNAVHFNGPLTDQLLSEAQQAGIWLIGAPPLGNPANGESPTPTAEIGANNAPVLAWHLGSAATAGELPPIASLVRQLRQLDRQLRRPTILNAAEGLLAYSRQVDILAPSRFVAGTSLDMKDYGAWLTSQMQLSRTGTPVWPIVQTQYAPSLIDQTSLLAGRQILDPAIDPDILRLQVYQAFSAGVRGIEFASSSRLDGNDNASRLRAASLLLLNLELELMEPWGAAGRFVDNVTSSDPGTTGAVFNADNSRLAVVTRCAKGSQFVPEPATDGTSLPPLPGSVPPPAPKVSDKPDNGPVLKGSKPLQRTGSGNPLDKIGGGQRSIPTGPTNSLAAAPSGPVTLIVPSVPDDQNVWSLSPGGLKPLRHVKTAGGTSIAIEDFPLTSIVLITSDPTVINAMQARLAGMAPRAAKLQREIAGAMREDVAKVAGRLVNQSQLPSAAGSLAEAQADLQRSDEQLAAGNWGRAYLSAQKSMLPLGRWKREVWQLKASVLPSPITSPLAVSFSTLPEQINFATSIATIPQSENLLPGGNFEDLAAMLSAGWRHFEHPPADVQTSVELSPMAPYGDKLSLRMHVGPTKPQATAKVLIESPPLWVTSAPVQVAAGDLVCIRGQVRVPAGVNGSVDGLMVVDSIGGEPLAERIDQTDGWREIAMYRVAPQAGSLTITFALTGVGDAWIDDVSVRILRRGNSTGITQFPATSPSPGTSNATLATGQPAFALPPRR